MPAGSGPTGPTTSTPRARTRSSAMRPAGSFERRVSSRAGAPQAAAQAATLAAWPPASSRFALGVSVSDAIGSSGRVETSSTRSPRVATLTSCREPSTPTRSSARRTVEPTAAVSASRKPRTSGSSCSTSRSWWTTWKSAASARAYAITRCGARRSAASRATAGHSASRLMSSRSCGSGSCAQRAGGRLVALAGGPAQDRLGAGVRVLDVVDGVLALLPRRPGRGRCPSAGRASAARGSSASRRRRSPRPARRP